MYLVTGGEKTLIYCANYRVASTATGATLVNTYGGEMVGSHHSPPPDEMDLTGCLVAETVRNHFDVFVSLWYKEGRKKEFNEWMEDILEGRHKFISPTKLYGRFPSNVVLRYENLQFEFENLCLWAGLPQKKLERNTTTREESGWQKYYNTRNYNRVKTTYKEELEHYGYL